MTSLFTDTDNNATATPHALIRGLKANVTQATVRAALPLHPDFPSLLSLSEVLTDWKIDNMALQLNTVEQLRELPLPFVAHLRKRNGWYVLVTNLTGDTITYTDSHEGRCTEPIAKFERQWSGVVLLAEPGEESGEPDYLKNRKQERLNELRTPFLVAGTLFLLFAIILSAAQKLTTPDWVLLLTKTIGLALSGLLVAKQLGSKNALTDRLCKINSKTDCDGVLNSPAAKLWGWLSWADVGLLYFAGGLVTVLFSTVIRSVTPDLLRPLLATIAFLALPYTVFSIYYQARVIRQWCPLCLGVQGVLLAEGLWAASVMGPLPIFWPPYLVISIAFLLPVLAWVLIKSGLSTIAANQQTHVELQRFKRNPHLFQSLLVQQPSMPPMPDDLHPIVLGNPTAEHTITLVTNPYCSPCARSHKELTKLLDRNPAINAKIVFVADGIDGKATQVAIHTLALAQQSDVVMALADWYEQPEGAFQNYLSLI